MQPPRRVAAKAGALLRDKKVSLAPARFGHANSITTIAAKNLIFPEDTVYPCRERYARGFSLSWKAVLSITYSMKMRKSLLHPTAHSAR